MSIEILCTLGPSSMSESVITRLEHLGVSLFRVNLSHTKLEDLETVVRTIQTYSRVPVCLDSEGAQIRTTSLVNGPVLLRENTTVTVHSRLVPGDPYNIAFYPFYTVALLREGDFISIDFNSVMTQVVQVHEDRATLRVINGGHIGSNKAVTVHRPISMPALTDKDKTAIAMGRELGIRHVALSFANRAEDVDETRALAGDGTFLISKIECRNGLDNLAAIARKSDAILIDRGDLSREIPIERIPLAQKYIIRTAKELGRKVYVATNLLETMVVAPTPTRAEVNDIFNTLQDGADGLVLAAETAVGKYPINCAAMIVKLVREFRSGVPDVPSSEAFSLLPEPHGGRLRIAMADEKERREAEQLPRMTLPDAVLRDAEQMALGLFSPVDGFMDREALESVLDRCRLPDGTVWPIPLVMPSPTSAPPAKGRRVALCSEAGAIHSVLDVGDVFEVDLDDMARRWDGFAPRSFPSATLIAGKVRLIERLPSPYRAHELTPEQTRFIFTQKGWTRVVAFQSRNVPHRAHEHIQSKAMERTHADGLFINPLTGPCRPGDVLPGAVIRGYETLLDFGAYPPGRAIVGCLSARPRGLGPREAVFTALCLKNMGCSHVIIGQSHSGDGVRELFGSLGDIGIEPVFFESLGWDPAGGTFVGQATNPDASPLLSADVRRALAEGRPLPDWTIRSILQETLRAELSAGRPLFCGGG